MIKYFKELLKTLKSIDSNLTKISNCVQENHHTHGDKASISVKHWNQ